MPHNSMMDQHQVDPYARSTSQYLEPPVGWQATLRHLGPGLILVGSIVGSGELIMTTKLGAQIGFALLWFILLSCVSKVVVLGELARHTISSGETFLVVFNRLPGPKGRRPGWLGLGWLLGVLASLILGLSVYLHRASLALSVPHLAGRDVWIGALGIAFPVLVALTGMIWKRRPRGRLDKPEGSERPVLNWFMWVWLVCQVLMFVNAGAIVGGTGQTIELAFPGLLGAWGDVWWTLVVSAVAGGVLLGGGYKLLERVSLVLVAGFTLITVCCAALLQWTPYAVGLAELIEGLRPSPLMASGIHQSAIWMTAMAAYATTGIGTWEFLSYTYWCVEKGYARHAGGHLEEAAWAGRARGWVRVMYTDVLLTMGLYTTSTVCFYVLGAAILHAEGLDPAGLATIGMLGEVYTRTLGSWASAIFVLGAFCVLFSTILSGVAGSARILADGLCVMGLVDRGDYRSRLRFIRLSVVLFLVLGLYTYFLFQDPTVMLVISGLISVAIYPTVGLGTMYLRHREVDRRLRPGATVTLLLWICGGSLAIIAPAIAVLMVAYQFRW